MTRISVVIVTWNEEQTIARCLPALLPELRDGDELIISDNASTDATLAVVASLKSSPRRLRRMASPIRSGIFTLLRSTADSIH